MNIGWILFVFVRIIKCILTLFAPVYDTRQNTNDVQKKTLPSTEENPAYFKHTTLITVYHDVNTK